MRDFPCPVKALILVLIVIFLIIIEGAATKPISSVAFLKLYMPGLIGQRYNGSILSVNFLHTALLDAINEQIFFNLIVGNFIQFSKFALHC